jgi:transposase
MTLAEALSRNTDLEVALAASVTENAELRQANAELLLRIQALEERLGQNSRNSSNPPSSDGPAVKRPPRSRKKAKKRGGQPGHAGRTRAMVPIEDVDEAHACVPATWD